MPLLDSFKVDHTKMVAPCVRLAKRMKTPSGDDITVYDLRFTQPNVSLLDEKGIHTLEHLFAGFMRDQLSKLTEYVEVIDISPMGCRTGFYMSIIGNLDEHLIAKGWLDSMRDVIAVKSMADIPELNIYQCGTAAMHSLDRAKDIAINILAKPMSIAHNEDLTLPSSLGQ